MPMVLLEQARGQPKWSLRAPWRWPLIYCDQFYIQVVEVLQLCRQNPTSFPLSFPRKAENALAFLHILLTSRKKTKGQISLQNSSLTQASFIIVHK